MKLLIIAVSALLLAVIAAYIAKRKEYNDLLDKYSELGRKNCDLTNKYRILENKCFDMTMRVGDLHRKLLSDKSYRFVVVSEDLTNYMENSVKRLEDEGYHYEKDRSFPTVLCFSKRIETKDEPKDETDPTEETLNQTF